MCFQKCGTELSVAAREDTLNASDLCIVVVVAHLAVGDDIFQILLLFMCDLQRILLFPLECGERFGNKRNTNGGNKKIAQILQVFKVFAG